MEEELMVHSGIVSMTNAVSFGRQRFKFYLEPSNRYKPLEGLEDSINTDEIMEKYKDKAYLNLPSSIITNSEEIQVGSGALKRRKQLERKKRVTEEDQNISRIKNEMRNYSLQSALNVPDLRETQTKQRMSRSQLREFYYSKNEIQKARSAEIQLKSYTYKICSRERTFAVNKGDVDTNGAKLTLVMFIVDRGFWCGSINQRASQKLLNLNIYTREAPLDNQENIAPIAQGVFNTTQSLPAETQENSNIEKLSDVLNNHDQIKVRPNHVKFTSNKTLGKRQADQINDGDPTLTNPLPRNVTPSEFEIAEGPNHYHMSSPSVHIEHRHKPKLRRLQISNFIEMFHFGTSFSKSSPITNAEYPAYEEDQQINKSQYIAPTP
ncbi:hypothetical protein EDC94DRAFT_656157 [Helicostylum pulchrum]|nr:hypothetical protein EDC94DRAFT_656157 [Helicostylum pulchrum]